MRKLIPLLFILAACGDNLDDAGDTGPPPPEAWHVALAHQGAIEGACDVPRSLQWDVDALDTDAPDVVQLDAESCGPLWRATGFDQWRLDCAWQTFSIEIIVPDDGIGDAAYLYTGADCLDFFDAEVTTP
jgi:hypothetical protein